MGLLELERVGKRYDRGARQDVVLRDVSLKLDVGELIAVWGRRRSGRSTLLRVASGIEPPDSGVVFFDGRQLTDHSGELLGSGIGYCRRALRPANECVLDRVVAGLLGQGVTPSVARSRARGGLERAGAAHCAAMLPTELDAAEVVRVSIARAIARQPKLLVIDEPTLGVELAVSDEILLLLRSLADGGMAVLMSASETTDLSVADRGLSLDMSELRGTLAPKLAPRDELAERRRSANA